MNGAGLTVSSEATRKTVQKNQENFQPVTRRNIGIFHF